MMYLRNRVVAISHALSGLRASLKREVHIKLFVFISILVVAFGAYFGLNKLEWILILSCIVFVICLELLNSAIEKLCDIVNPEQHPGIKYIKDVLAGAVLLASVYAFVLGVLIFLPYITAQ